MTGFRVSLKSTLKVISAKRRRIITFIIKMPPQTPDPKSGFSLIFLDSLWAIAILSPLSNYSLNEIYTPKIRIFLDTLRFSIRKCFFSDLLLFCYSLNKMYSKNGTTDPPNPKSGFSQTEFYGKSLSFRFFQLSF